MCYSKSHFSRVSLINLKLLQPSLIELKAIRDNDFNTLDSTLPESSSSLKFLKAKFLELDKLSFPMEKDDNLYELKIGNRVLTSFRILSLSNKPPIPTLDFICDIHTTEIKSLDLKDEVSLVRRSNNEKEFGGHVHDLSYSERSAVFMCKGGNSYFHNLKVTFEFLNTNLFKVAWFNFRLAFKKENINFEEGMLKQVNLVNKEYICITPVRNIVLPRDLTIGDVTFYSNFASPKDQIIRNSNNGKRDSAWKEIPVRARVKVIAEDFYAAINEGMQLVSKAVDIIAFRNDLSFPFIGDSEKLDFRNVRYFARVDLTTKIFCKETAAADAVVSDLRTVEETILRLDGDKESYLAPVIKLFEDIIRADAELSEEQRIIALGLHWLKLGVYATDPETKLLNLWNAVEFAANWISADRRFTRADIEQIESGLREIKINGIPLSEEKHEILVNKINQINNAPLMVRLHDFISRNHIPFDDSEFEVIQNARRKRNEIEHGKSGVKIERYELEKLQSLIERIILAKIELASHI